jgi:hypothetical protein
MIVVEATESADAEFSYTVRAVRKGYEDEPVAAEPSNLTEAEPEGPRTTSNQ